MGFFGRGQADSEVGPALQVEAADTGAKWLVSLTADRSRAARVRRGAGVADCTVTGAACDLYLLLWNRAGIADGGVAVSGDPEVLTSWQAGMQVRWS
jgi:MDMPI C-terminal domain